MATIIKAFILIDTDDASEASEAAFVALNNGVFDSNNPIVDFVTGFEHSVEFDSRQYRDGDFVAHVPAARFLATANRIELPI